MTEDIWSEKPKSGNETCGCYHGELYAAEEMDAWLEKVKAYYMDAWNALEALKHYFPDLNTKSYNTVNQHLGILKEKAEKLGDISTYPENKFGRMTVLDYFDLVEMQADTYTMRALTAEQKLEAAKTHLTEYPDVDGEICKDCPYPQERKTREGACGNCAVGTVKFWLQDHKKILEAEE